MCPGELTLWPVPMLHKVIFVFLLKALVKEEIRLVSTIDQIDKAVGIVPRGAYVKTPLGPVHENRSFEGKSTWGHRENLH